jgi:HK97 gp10 family phage protein
MANYVKWYGKDVERQILSATEKAVLAGCQLIGKDTKLSMVAGTGREYFRTKKKLIHRASVEGQPPAPDTGRLKASITVNWTNSGLPTAKVSKPAKEGDGISMPPTEAGKFTGRVGTNVEYAQHLEFGTVKMGPRPFLRPAFEKNISKIRALFDNLIKK